MVVSEYRGQPEVDTLAREANRHTDILISEDRRGHIFALGGGGRGEELRVVMSTGVCDWCRRARQRFVYNVSFQRGRGGASAKPGSPGGRRRRRRRYRPKQSGVHGKSGGFMCMCAGLFGLWWRTGASNPSEVPKD